MSQRHPIPAVAAVIVREGAILLVQRGTPPNQGLWSLPGGRMEWGETLAQALQREVAEETGLQVAVGALAGVRDLLVPGDAGIAFHYVLLDYRAEVTGGTLRPADDVTGARWVALTALPAMQLTDGLLELLHEGGILPS